MARTMISKTGSNWVDQGHPPLQTIRRVLGHEFSRHAPADTEWLEAQANTIVAMVAAGATETQVANYLRALAAESTHAPASEMLSLAAIALWHITKAALVRDTAEKLLRSHA